MHAQKNFFSLFLRLFFPSSSFCLCGQWQNMHPDSGWVCALAVHLSELFCFYSVHFLVIQQKIDELELLRDLCHFQASKNEWTRRMEAEHSGSSCEPFNCPLSFPISSPKSISQSMFQSIQERRKRIKIESSRAEKKNREWNENWKWRIRVIIRRISGEEKHAKMSSGICEKFFDKMHST